MDVSADLISQVTDGVLDECQSRRLDQVYPLIFIDALMVKIGGGVVTNRTVYLAVGIDCEGAEPMLGLRVGPTTGQSAKFWMSILSELRSRGVADVCIVCYDGLPEEITVTWPQTIVQLRVVHLMRADLRYASRKYCVRLSRDLRQYTPPPTRPPPQLSAWKQALQVFTIYFDGRIPTQWKPPRSLRLMIGRSHWQAPAGHR